MVNQAQISICVQLHCFPLILKEVTQGTQISSEQERFISENSSQMQWKDLWKAS